MVFLFCVPSYGDGIRYQYYSMKKIAPVLNDAFMALMRERDIPPDQRGDFLKWLRFYLDFCAKYEHPPRDQVSLAPFLQKLTQRTKRDVLVNMLFINWLKIN